MDSGQDRQSRPMLAQGLIAAPHTFNNFYKTRMCRRNGGRVCSWGRSCNFAHSVEELRPSYDLTKTKMCPLQTLSGSCGIPLCRYAHSISELRYTETFYKTQRCIEFTITGSCLMGNNCRHAHGTQELRPGPKPLFIPHPPLRHGRSSAKRLMQMLQHADGLNPPPPPGGPNSQGAAPGPSARRPPNANAKRGDGEGAQDMSTAESVNLLRALQAHARATGSTAARPLPRGGGGGPRGPPRLPLRGLPSSSSSSRRPLGPSGPSGPSGAPPPPGACPSRRCRDSACRPLIPGPLFSEGIPERIPESTAPDTQHTMQIPFALPGGGPPPPGGPPAPPPSRPSEAEERPGQMWASPATTTFRTPSLSPPTPSKGALGAPPGLQRQWGPQGHQWPLESLLAPLQMQTGEEGNARERNPNPLGFVRRGESVQDSAAYCDAVRALTDMLRDCLRMRQEATEAADKATAAAAVAAAAAATEAAEAEAAEAAARAAEAAEAEERAAAAETVEGLSIAAFVQRTLQLLRRSTDTAEGCRRFLGSLGGGSS